MNLTSHRLNISERHRCCVSQGGPAKQSWRRLANAPSGENNETWWNTKAGGLFLRLLIVQQPGAQIQYRSTRNQINVALLTYFAIPHFFLKACFSEEQ
jgi:hypothetical protein